MYSIEKFDLGRYRGHNYFFTGFVEPEPKEGEDYDPDTDAENYGANIVRAAASPIEDNTEIVRMDTRHGRPHLDKEYLPDDSEEDDKVFLDDGYEYSRMKGYLLTHWKYFVDQYHEYRESD